MSLHAPGILPKHGLLTDPIERVPDEVLRFGNLGFDYAEIGIEDRPRNNPRARPSRN